MNLSRLAQPFRKRCCCAFHYARRLHLYLYPIYYYLLSIRSPLPHLELHFHGYPPAPHQPVQPSIYPAYAPRANFLLFCFFGARSSAPAGNTTFGIKTSLFHVYAPLIAVAPELASPALPFPKYKNLHAVVVHRRFYWRYSSIEET